MAKSLEIRFFTIRFSKQKTPSLTCLEREMQDSKVKSSLCLVQWPPYLPLRWLGLFPEMVQEDVNARWKEGAVGMSARSIVGLGPTGLSDIPTE